MGDRFGYSVIPTIAAVIALLISPGGKTFLFFALSTTLTTVLFIRFKSHGNELNKCFTNIEKLEKEIVPLSIQLEPVEKEISELISKRSVVNKIGVKGKGK